MAPSSVRVTTLSGSAVPVTSTIGANSFMSTVSPATLVMAGAIGGSVSITTASPAERGLALPAASVAVIVRVCAPSASALPGVISQAPLAFALAVPITEMSSVS